MSEDRSWGHAGYRIMLCTGMSKAWGSAGHGHEQGTGQACPVGWTVVGTVWSCPGDHYSYELPCRFESGSCDLSLSWNAWQPGYGNTGPVVQSGDSHLRSGKGRLFRAGAVLTVRGGLGWNGWVGKGPVGVAEAVRFKMVMDCGAPEKQKGVSR